MRKRTRIVVRGPEGASRKARLILVGPRRVLVELRSLPGEGVTRHVALRRGELRLFLDVFNAYDRDNLVGYDHNVVVSGTVVSDTKKPRKQLPLLPSIGGSWEF